jgi:PAS domain S-box-containing protein
MMMMDDRKCVDSMSDKFSDDWTRRLLQVITEAQQKLLVGRGLRSGFDSLLEGLLSVTGSEYGFVGQVMHSSNRDPFLKTYSISDVALDDGTRELMNAHEDSRLEFHDLDTLYGQVLTTGLPLIANDPAGHPGRGGLPAGNLPLKSFLGLPIFVGDEFVGVVGLSNRESGYDQSLIDALQPIVSATGYMIVAASEKAIRIEAEAEARSGELLRHSVIETALDCVIAMDHEGRIIEFNPAAETTFGWSRDDVMGRSLADVIIPEGLRKLHTAGMAHYLETGEGPVLGKRIEVPSIRRDGTEFPVELAITVANLDDNPVFTAYLRDITERKQNESDLQRAREAAEAGSRAKTEFVATVSHEIRTPINAITGALGLLKTAGMEDGDRKFLQTAQKSATTLLGLVNDVLDLSRIDADRLTLEIVPTRPEEICDSVVHLLADKAEANGNLLGSVVHDCVPGMVMIDGGRVRQVLINLVANAVKFTRGGNVRIDVRVDGGELQFCVADTGEGISEEDLPRLFTEFSQFGRGREFGGAGLGLAISKRLVDLMEGSVHASSKLGEGSRFSFSVPFDVSEDTVDRRLNGRKGLIVTGNDFLAEIIRDQGQAWGIDCQLARTTQRARDVLNTDEGIDFVLLALDGSPTRSRLTHGAALAALAKGRDIPLGLIVSGGEHCSDHLEQKLDSDVVLTMPLLQEDLSGGIWQLLGGQSTEGLSWSHTVTMDYTDANIRVLLADDSQANRLVMGEMLKRAGFDVDVVADGREAIEAVDSLPYDVVLMDIEMPDVDGMEATRQIRELKGAAGQVPIVALTANVLADSRKRFLEAGMNDYVSKPVDRQTLSATVLRWARVDDGAVSEVIAADGETLLIDEDGLRMLGEDTSQELVPKLVNVFVAELRARAGNISDGMDSGDMNRLAREAHALKSSAATYGALAIAERARWLDQACTDENGVEAGAQCRALLELVEPTIAAFEAHPLAQR